MSYLETILNAKAKAACEKACNGEKINLEKALGVVDADVVVKEKAYAIFYNTYYTNIISDAVKQGDYKKVYSGIEKLEDNVGGDTNLIKQSFQVILDELGKNSKDIRQMYTIGKKLLNKHNNWDDIAVCYKICKDMPFKDLDEVFAVYNLYKQSKQDVSDFKKFLKIYVYAENGFITQLSMNNLSFNSRQLTDISYLKNLTNLEMLEVPYLNKGISALKDLKKLEELCIHDVSKGLSFLEDVKQIKKLNISDFYYELDISPLKQLKSLEKLSLQCRHIKNIRYLDEIKTLTNLDIYFPVKSTDLYFLKSFKKLEDLNVVVDNCSCLKECYNLKQLQLSGSKITDISPIKNLKNIGYLDISYSGIKDISPLKNLEKLWYLNLAGTPVKNISKTVKHMKNLREIHLYKTRYSKYEKYKDVVDSIKKSGVKVNFNRVLEPTHWR